MSITADKFDKALRVFKDCSEQHIKKIVSGGDVEGYCNLVGKISTQQFFQSPESEDIQQLLQLSESEDIQQLFAKYFPLIHDSSCEEAFYNSMGCSFESAPYEASISCDHFSQHDMTEEQSKKFDSVFEEYISELMKALDSTCSGENQHAGSEL